MNKRNIARSTCVTCHEMMPRTEMKQVTVKEYSGSSIGASTNLFANKKGKRNTRISGRQYYRNKKVWMCFPCATEHRNKQINKFILQVVFVVVVIGCIYFFVPIE